MRVRVRWSQAGPALLGIAAVLLTLRVAPSFLKPPAPAPLPADVGLPRVEAASAPAASRRPEGTTSSGGSDPGTKRRLGRVVSGGGGLRRAEASEARLQSGNRSNPVPEEARSTSRPPPPDDRTRPPPARSLNPSLHPNPPLQQVPNPRPNQLPPHPRPTTARWSLRRTSYSPSPFWQPHVNTSWS
jgi:translation initiation factor IF-2